MYRDSTVSQNNSWLGFPNELLYSFRGQRDAKMLEVKVAGLKKCMNACISIVNCKGQIEIPVSFRPFTLTSRSIAAL